MCFNILVLMKICLIVGLIHNLTASEPMNGLGIYIYIYIYAFIMVLVKRH